MLTDMQDLFNMHVHTHSQATKTYEQSMRPGSQTPRGSSTNLREADKWAGGRGGEEGPSY